MFAYRGLHYLWQFSGETGRCCHGARAWMCKYTKSLSNEVQYSNTQMWPLYRSDNFLECHMTFPLIVYRTVGEKSQNVRSRRDGERRETEWEMCWHGVSLCCRNGVWARRRCWDYGGRLSSFLAPEKLTDPRPVCSLFQKTVVYIVSWYRIKPFVTKQMEEITRLEWIIDFPPEVAGIYYITNAFMFGAEIKWGSHKSKLPDSWQQFLSC